MVADILQFPTTISDKRNLLHGDCTHYEICNITWIGNSMNIKDRLWSFFNSEKKLSKNQQMIREKLNLIIENRRGAKETLLTTIQFLQSINKDEKPTAVGIVMTYTELEKAGCDAHTMTLLLEELKKSIDEDRIGDLSIMSEESLEIINNIFPGVIPDKTIPLWLTNKSDEHSIHVEEASLDEFMMHMNKQTKQQDKFIE